jgi:RNA polymerase sigma-70 factor, ECF subfamily
MEAGARSLESVYREHGQRMFRALVAYTGHPEIARDAVGEAFAQALARGDAIRDPAAWVWRVAFIVASAELRERHQVTPATDVEPSYELGDPTADVFDALSRISPNQRLAVVLHDYADRPTSEIADLLGISRATVHVHLSTGRRRLRRLLEVRDD